MANNVYNFIIVLDGEFKYLHYEIYSVACQFLGLRRSAPQQAQWRRTKNLFYTTTSPFARGRQSNTLRQTWRSKASAAIRRLGLSHPTTSGKFPLCCIPPTLLRTSPATLHIHALVHPY